jgi:hypothetical protein
MSDWMTEANQESLAAVEEKLKTVERWDYTPPEVSETPVYEGDVIVAYLPHPAFGHDWPSLTTLRHQAALVELRTGLKVRVAPNESRTEYSNDPEFFDVLTGHAIGGPAPYEVVWSWMSGFEVGVNEYQRKVHDK